MAFIHIPGTINPADMFTKPLGPHIHNKLVHPLLYGKTMGVANGGECQRGVHPCWCDVVSEINSGSGDGPTEGNSKKKVLRLVGVACTDGHCRDSRSQYDHACGNGAERVGKHGGRSDRVGHGHGSGSEHAGERTGT